MHLKVYLNLFLLVCSLCTVAQESTNTTGGEASGSGGTVSYSVGQVFLETNQDTEYTITQGVQQAYEISVTTGLARTGISLEIDAFPNPTTDYLTLKVKIKDFTKPLSYKLFDMNGKLLGYKENLTEETNIKMTEYFPGIYFVKMFSNNQEIKTFKIVKK